MFISKFHEQATYKGRLFWDYGSRGMRVHHGRVAGNQANIVSDQEAEKYYLQTQACGRQSCKLREDWNSENPPSTHGLIPLSDRWHFPIIFPNSATNSCLRIQKLDPVRDIYHLGHHSRWGFSSITISLIKKFSEDSLMASYHGCCEKIATTNQEITSPQVDLLRPQFWNSEFPDWEINLHLFLSFTINVIFSFQLNKQGNRVLFF